MVRVRGRVRGRVRVRVRIRVRVRVRVSGLACGGGLERVVTEHQAMQRNAHTLLARAGRRRAACRRSYARGQG